MFLYKDIYKYIYMSIYKLHNELDDPNFSQINKLNLSLLNPEQIYVL